MKELSIDTLIYTSISVYTRIYIYVLRNVRRYAYIEVYISPAREMVKGWCLSVTSLIEYKRR